MAQGPQEPSWPWSPIAGAPAERSTDAGSACGADALAAAAGSPAPGSTADGAQAVRQPVRQRVPDGDGGRGGGEAGGHDQAGRRQGGTGERPAGERSHGTSVSTAEVPRHQRKWVDGGSIPAAVRAVPAVTPLPPFGVPATPAEPRSADRAGRPRCLASPPALLPSGDDARDRADRERPFSGFSRASQPGGARGGRGAKAPARASDGRIGPTIRRVTGCFSLWPAAPPRAAPAGPLAGLLVVDLTRALAGPHAAMMLGDLGARVIKVETPEGGDDTRGWGPPFVDPPERAGSPPTSSPATATRSRSPPTCGRTTAARC